MGGKLTKFRGHEGINENHESFYPRKFLAVRYIGSIGSIGPVILVNVYNYVKRTGHETHDKIAMITGATLGLQSN